MLRSYKQYRKAVKKAGGREVATPGQYARIKKRLKAKYGYKTVRTSSIEKALRKSGLTDSQIAKLRGG